jgi:Tfp pilus assembly protein PilF
VERAEEAFEKVLKLDPNAANAHHQLANLLMRRQRDKETTPPNRPNP